MAKDKFPTRGLGPTGPRPITKPDPRAAQNIARGVLNSGAGNSTGTSLGRLKNMSRGSRRMSSSI